MTTIEDLRRQLFDCLTKLDIEVDVTSHHPVHTAKDAHTHRLLWPGGHCKSLLLVNKQRRFYLIVMPDCPKLDLSTFAQQHNTGRLSFAKPHDIWRLLRVKPGSLSPLGLLFDTDHEIDVCIDAALMDHAILHLHPLINTQTLHLSSNALSHFLTHTGHTPTIATLPLQAKK